MFAGVDVPESLVPDPAHMPDKARVHAALVKVLEDSLARMRSSQRISAEGVTHEDARAEGDKDMRATEASYVARGQAMRVEAIAGDLQRLVGAPLPKLKETDPVQGGALVLIADAADQALRRVLFVHPSGGGSELVVDGVHITVLGPQSPLGRALIGRFEGDTAALGGREWEILAVR